MHFSLLGPGAAYDAYIYNVVERKTAGLYFGTSLALATDGFMGGTIGFSGNPDSGEATLALTLVF